MRSRKDADSTGGRAALRRGSCVVQLDPGATELVGAALDDCPHFQSLQDRRRGAAAAPSPPVVVLHDTSAPIFRSITVSGTDQVSGTLTVVVRRIVTFVVVPLATLVALDGMTNDPGSAAECRVGHMVEALEASLGSSSNGEPRLPAGLVADAGGDGERVSYEGSPKTHWLVWVGGEPRPFGGLGRSGSEGCAGAALLAASKNVVGVTFCARAAEVAAAVLPAVEFVLRHGPSAKSTATLDAESLTEPGRTGPKVDVNWERGYVRMLLEVPGLTDARARCVVAVFPTLRALLTDVSRLECGGALEDAPLTPSLAALASMAEPDSTDRGADRASRRFGEAQVRRLVSVLRAPFDEGALRQ